MMALLVSREVYHEMNFFLAAFITGLMLKALGNLLNLFRAAVRHNALATAAEDIFYWIVAALTVFLVSFLKNDGLIRGFSLLGIGLGILAFKLTFGRIFQIVILRLGKKRKKCKKGLKRKRKIGTMSLGQGVEGGTNEQEKRQGQKK